ncbi:MAG: MFS transporter [Rubripirellula sp.]
MIQRSLSQFASRLPFFYGFVMMPVAMMLQIGTSSGQSFAIAAFTPALRESLQMSDSRLSFAYMLGTFLAAFPLFLVGPASDRFGLKPVTLVAVIALSCVCILAAHVNGFGTLLLVFFLLRFLGQGSLTLLSSNAIAMWFRSRIGRVSAVMSIGTALAFAWIPGWISDAIDQFGWRQTYEWIGILTAVCLVPIVSLFFINRPEDIDQQVDGFSSQPNDQTKEQNSPQPDSFTLPEALRTRSFYILATTSAVWAMAGTAVVFYLYVICQDRGFSRQVGSDLFKTFGLSMLVAQLLGGVLGDFLPLNRLLGIGTVALCAGLGLICMGQSVTAFHGFAALFGGGQGLLVAVGAVVWVRYYGRAHLGSIRGTMWCCTVAGSGCGPLLMGVSRDQTGDFHTAILAFFVLLGVLSVTAWWATPPNKIDQPKFGLDQ